MYNIHRILKITIIRFLKILEKVFREDSLVIKILILFRTYNDRIIILYKQIW